jgi:hypothetical protein
VKKEIILRDTPEAPRNDPFSDERLEGLHEPTSILAKEFSVLLNPKTILTPHLCRKGCKHYDSVGDPKGGNFREFYGKSNGTLVVRDRICENFESSRLCEILQAVYQFFL